MIEIVSADDHVIEPPNVWVDRLPRKSLERGPRIRVVTSSNGAQHEAWVYEDDVVGTNGMYVAATFSAREDWSTEPIRFADMRPGVYDPIARVADMDQAGILASLCFPTFPRFGGQRFVAGKDKTLAALCVKAYNDWILEEWSAPAPGRLIPMAIVPMWDPSLAADEVIRVAGLGVKAIAFSEDPHAVIGLPSIHDPDCFWDPLFSALTETGLPVCLHIGSSSNIFSPPGVPDHIVTGMAPFGAMVATFNWCASSLLERFPTVQIVLSESEIGWIPFVLERMDYTFDRLAPSHGLLEQHSRRPSEVFREQFHSCFITDDFGISVALEHIGANRVMLETDYPHGDSSWPDTQEIVAAQLRNLDPKTRFDIARGNAERLFDFTPSRLGSL